MRKVLNPCPSCRGSGESAVSPRWICEACRGTGEAPDPDAWTGGLACPGCRSPDQLHFRSRESSCGGYDYTQYWCKSCGHTHSVDGADA